ncbi:MAG: phosphatidate cytidylyltransferase [bacterium]
MLKQRLLSSAVIVPLLFLGLLFLPSAALLVVLISVSTLMILEFYNALNRADIPAFRYVGAGFGVAIILATYVGFMWKAGDTTAASRLARATEWETIILACAVLALMIRQFPQKHNAKPLPTIACTLFGVLYVPFLMNFFTKLAFVSGNAGWTTPLANTPGFYLILYVVLASKLTDAGAFFVGRSFGRHKLFPRLSPGKTWEGFAGGTVTCILMSVAFFKYVGSEQLGGLVIPLSHAVALGIILAIAGMAGDLAESVLKRASMLKDSGSIVPGIGGMLDMVDSAIFIAPLFYFYIRLMM